VANAGLELGDATGHVVQPRARVGLALAHSGHLVLGDLDTLQRVVHQGVGARELRQVPQPRLHRTARVLDARDLLAQVAGERAGVVEVAAQRLDAAHLLVERAHLLARGLELGAHRLHLVLDVAHGEARLAQALEPALARAHVGAQVGDALAHRLDAAGLEVEALDRVLHLLGHRREILARRQRLLVRLALELRDLVRALEHGIVQRIQRRHLLAQRGQRLLVLLLLPDAGVDVAHGAVEVVALRERAVERLAVRLERGGLLRHRVAERLERHHLALHGVDVGLDAVQALHGQLDALDAALLVLQRAAQLVAAAIHGLELRRRHLVRVQQPVVLLAQPGHALGGALELAVQRLGVATQQLERLLDLEEAREPLAELGGRVHLRDQVGHRGLDLLRALERGGET
jgi:hypothetical protein